MNVLFKPGKSIAPQQRRSTIINISRQKLCFSSPISVSSVRMSATFANTCSGITIINIFLSLSLKICLTKAQPVPISTNVMKSNAPFNK